MSNRESLVTSNVYLLLSEKASENVTERAAASLLLLLISTLFAATVILAPLVTVRKHFVGSRHVVKLLLCLIIPWVLVRMVLQSESTICLLNVSGLCVLFQLQDLVEVPILLSQGCVDQESEN